MTAVLVVVVLVPQQPLLTTFMLLAPAKKGSVMATTARTADARAAADASAGKEKEGGDDDAGASGGGALAATAADDVRGAGADKENDDDGEKEEDPDWVRTGFGSRVFLRRGPGPAVEYDAEKLQFWTGHSYMYQEVLLNDKYDHSSPASPGAVMMVASTGGFVIVIVSTATGHVVSVTPKIGVYTFSADVAGSEHVELCAKAAGHVKDSGVLRSLPDKAFTVKLVPMALHDEATATRPQRKAATAAAALRKPQMDGDGTPAPSAAAAAAAEEEARAVADAAAARRANALKPPPKKAPRGGSKKGKKGGNGDGDDGEGADEHEQEERKGAKRAVQPLVIGDYVRRDDGTVSKIVTASTKLGWAKMAPGRKAKRGEGSVLMDPS